MVQIQGKWAVDLGRPQLAELVVWVMLKAPPLISLHWAMVMADSLQEFCRMQDWGSALKYWPAFHRVELWMV